MRILRSFVARPEQCPYLEDQTWRMKYQQIGRMQPSEYDGRLLDGWFKYGHYFQRPVCEECHACLSMRVPVDEFTLTRTQRRTVAKNSDLTIRYSTPPLCDEERVELHNRYRMHQMMENNWQYMGWDLDTYYNEFVDGPVPMTEISIWSGDTLCAITLTDVSKEAVAGVTHYYAPELKSRSIGLFAMLQTFFLAQKLEKKWVYLGYYVANSPTMGYKIQFLPCELRDWDGNWFRVEKADLKEPQPEILTEIPTETPIELLMGT
jgi:leucyl-tRNA---protein transferase